MIILGSTGSIGTQALQIARAEHLAIEVLCAGDNIDLLNAQIAEFRPKIAVIKDSAKRHLVKGVGKVLCGESGILEAIREAKSNFVLNALVGFSGDGASLEAMRLGKTLALANKESLVVAGFLMDGAEVGKIIPVDSEHFALKELIDSIYFNSPLGLHSADLVNRHKARTPSPLSLCRFTKNHESQTENPSVVDSAFAESSEKNAESTLDSTIPQNLTRKNRRISHAKCESAPDSANSQNLARSAKSFCYFLLSQKVESSLPYQPQLTSDSTIQQNLIKNNVVRSTQNLPVS